MIMLVVVASILIVAVTVYQYREEGKAYHNERLERKEQQVLQSIAYALKETTYPVNTENLGHIFRTEIYKIADLQNVNFNIYDLDGNLIKSSRPSFEEDSISNCLDAHVLNHLWESGDKRYVEEKRAAGGNYQATYTYIHDPKFKPIGIMNLPYFEDNTFNNKELTEFLFRLGGVYLLMLIIAVFLAYFISKYITRSLQTIVDKMNRTNLGQRNEKIDLENPGEEFGKLVDSYNRMIDELEESAEKLARSEREQAWREMAKQVAHEIANPLTPLRLTAQNFERKFDPRDPDIQDKVKEFSRTLIQQIDTMSNIATAFSSFADMPAQQNETLNVVGIVKLALEIFTEEYIHFSADQEEIIAKLDRTQLIRVITNLVKNAIQAVPEVESPRILVTVGSQGKKVVISVADNGQGIPEELGQRIFEPKFTTKSSGTGLGLGMVKNIVENYGGTITFTSKEGKGTVFTIKFPKHPKIQ